MSVYKRATSPHFHFDFQWQGRRFHGSTGQTTRRAAEAVERQKRLEAATGQLGAVANMTLDLAAGRYWAERGIDRGDAVDVERRIAQLLELIGKNTRLGDIDQACVAEAIERRRGIARIRSAKDDAKAYLPSNATVNRDVIETLRPVLKRARTHWTKRGTQHGLPDIDWRELRMTEPRGLSRVYTETERAAWLAACPDDSIRLAVELLLTNGLRFGELFFPLDAVDLDPQAPTLKLAKGRKRDVILHIPLRRDHGRQVAALHSRAAGAGLKHLWFHRVGKKLVSLTYAQLEYRISKAAEDAGLKGGRLIHGARHHAASAVVARTGNIKAVQALLGHASITSSQRYAHMDIKALRAAVEDAAPAVNPGPRKRKAPHE
jgi:integrase